MLNESGFFAVAVAPSSPSNVYAGTRRGVYHSPNGGLTWSLIHDTGGDLARPYVQNVAVHPQDSDAVYAMVSDGSILRHGDGSQWKPIGALQCPANQLVFESGRPQTMYARSCGRVFKSVDEGHSWREVGRTAAWIALDPSLPNMVYAASAPEGVFRSTDRGETWARIREPLDQDVRAIHVDPVSPGTIYVGANASSNGFIARFNPTGALTLSTYLGGLDASASAVAVDGTGAIVVVGTAGREFPTIQPVQRAYGGARDAFVARVVIAE